VFITISYFHPSVIFVGKAKSIPFKQSQIVGFTQVVSLQARVLVIFSHFYPNLIFAGNAKRLHLEWSRIRGSTWLVSEQA
jgi:hypothetical protein